MAAFWAQIKMLAEMILQKKSCTKLEFSSAEDRQGRLQQC